MDDAELLLFIIAPVSCILLVQYSRGPARGSRGRVVLVFEDNILSKIGVRFDKPVPGGVDFAGLCGNGYGYFCYGKFQLSD